MRLGRVKVITGWKFRPFCAVKQHAAHPSNRALAVLLGMKQIAIIIDSHLTQTAPSFTVT
ncbi:hypothetical protein AA18895_0129 [Acetobacter ghanensis DSM 18895]|nr:hypothetical protein AA18895_0129 [Acetobacter ghanensis DSM 18895]